MEENPICPRRKCNKMNLMADRLDKKTMNNFFVHRHTA